ncbi:PhzF family phenazine biosynthesis protein [Streptomyces sp. NPDC058240]|uniref:PhzF family phenazine biosynthesis protein n=1 Tax=Streptomyces sp. NPDC058240 TaxID=3346396 RepID=UPI0036E3637C
MAVGGVVESAATGAAAAAFGADARELKLVPSDAKSTIQQGRCMGRPSRLEVTLRPCDDHILVSGTAVLI